MTNPRASRSPARSVKLSRDVIVNAALTFLDREGWDALTINALANQGVTVIDLMCDANFYNPSIFSSDGFHPNDAGYTYLTDRVYAAATGSAPAPRASCPQMTVF